MSAQAPVGALARSHPITQHSLHEKACPESKGSPLGSLPVIRARWQVMPQAPHAVSRV